MSKDSVDWVLSHWAHFTVHRFICVCVFVFFLFHTAFLLHSFCIIVSTARWTWHGEVDLMGLKPNPLDLFLQCFDTVGWVI